jgi:hypothetical protein
MVIKIRIGDLAVPQFNRFLAVKNEFTTFSMMAMFTPMAVTAVLVLTAMMTSVAGNRLLYNTSDSSPNSSAYSYSIINNVENGAMAAA